MKIIKNTSVLFVDKILNVLLGFVITIFITNIYDERLLGYYSLAVTIVSFSPVLFEMLNKRLIKKYYYLKKISVRQHFIFTILVSIVFSVVVYLFAFYIYNSIDFYLIVGFVLLNNILINISYVYENYLEGIFKLNNIYKGLFFSRIIALLGTFLFFYFLRDILIVLLFVSLTLFMRIIILRNYTLSKINQVNSSDEKSYLILKDLLLEGKFLWFTNISYIVYAQIDKLMLGSMINVESVGYYFLANMIINTMYMLIPIIRQISFGSQITKNIIQVEGEILKFNSYIVYIYILLLFVSHLLIATLIKNIYGEAYNISIILFRILSTTLFIRAFIAFRSNYYIINKNYNFLFISSIISMITNIFLNYILIKNVGIIGAPIATSISLVISSIMIDLFNRNGRRLLIIEFKSLNPILLISNLKNLFGVNKSNQV